MTSLDQLQDRTGYSFQQPDLLLTAVTHRSYRSIDPHCGDYERLEFLGDAVLGLVVSSKFYRDLALEAGDLTKRTSQVVSRAACDQVARQMNLDLFIRVGPAASLDGTTILSNVIEAVIGAIYIDGGIEPATAFVMRHFESLLTHAMAEGVENPKATLNELLLRERKQAPTYRVIETTGPDHAPTYIVEAMMDDHVLGRGSGKSKREAEAAAAKSAIESLSA
ncbi:ribonuclease III [bacterium]|nr:ribonuclease III [bacterium]